MNFLNENRNRYYGIRVGDYVHHVVTVGGEKKIVLEGTVVEDGGMDNNRCYVMPKGDDKAVSCVAEWLIIVRPVETWLPGKQPDTIITMDPYGQPPTSQESLDHYGGYLVAESIPPPFRNLILAAPAMLEALEMFEKEDTQRRIPLWSHQREVMNQALRIIRHGRDDV